MVDALKLARETPASSSTYADAIVEQTGPECTGGQAEPVEDAIQHTRSVRWTGSGRRLPASGWGRERGI